MAASILTVAYHVLPDTAPYGDPGGHHVLRVDQALGAERPARQIRQLGYEVETHKTA